MVKILKDHMSDLMLNLLNSTASGSVHNLDQSKVFPNQDISCNQIVVDVVLLFEVAYQLVVNLPLLVGVFRQPVSLRLL